VPRHGSGRPLHLSQLGSTPHDRVTSPQIRSSHSLPLDRPRQDASRHPPVVTNRPTTYRVRREPPLIQQPIHHPPACSSASTPFTHFIRGTQIPIAQDATPTSPSRGFLPWRFAYAGPPVHAAPPSWVRHPQTFTGADSCTAQRLLFVMNKRPVPPTVACFRQGQVLTWSSKVPTRTSRS
jgi:hypothetical protein